MLTERDLLETIEECRAMRKPTASACQLMAACYTILDHLLPESSRPANPAPVQMYSMSPEPVETRGSEFVRAARKAGMPRLLAVLDEHMDCVRALYPREYTAIIQRLQD